MINDNTRTGSEPNNEVVAVRILEQMSPPDGVTSADEVTGELYGPENVYVRRRLIGELPLLADGSVRMFIPASTPVILELLDKDGNVIDRQREEEQLGPGETEPRMISHPMASTASVVAATMLLMAVRPASHRDPMCSPVHRHIHWLRKR